MHAYGGECHLSNMINLRLMILAISNSISIFNIISAWEKGSAMLPIESPFNQINLRIIYWKFLQKWAGDHELTSDYVPFHWFLQIQYSSNKLGYININWKLKHLKHSQHEPTIPACNSTWIKLNKRKSSKDDAIVKAKMTNLKTLEKHRGNQTSFHPLEPPLQHKIYMPNEKFWHLKQFLDTEKQMPWLTMCCSSSSFLEIYY